MAWSRSDSVGSDGSYTFMGTSHAGKTGKPSSPVKNSKVHYQAQSWHRTLIVCGILTTAGLEGIRGRTDVVTVAGTKGRLSTQIMQYKDVPRQWMSANTHLWKNSDGKIRKILGVAVGLLSLSPERKWQTIILCRIPMLGYSPTILGSIHIRQMLLHI